MILSAKAKRVVSEAVAAMSDPGASDVWQSFTASTSGSMPPDVTQVALRAIEHAERGIARRLKRRLTEDERADLGNDLEFLRAVEADLRRRSRGTQAAQ
jgi:hypothetical protein